MRDRSLGASSSNYWPGPYIVLDIPAAPDTWLDDEAVGAIHRATKRYIETVREPYVRDDSVDSPRVLSVAQVGIEYSPGRRVIEVVMLEWRPLSNTSLKTRRVTIKARPGSSVEYDSRQLLTQVGPSDVVQIMREMIAEVQQALTLC